MPSVCLGIKVERKSRDPGKRKSCQRKLGPEVLCRDEKDVKTSTCRLKPGFTAHCSVCVYDADSLTELIL